MNKHNVLKNRTKTEFISAKRSNEPNNCVTYSHNFFEKLVQFKNMLDGDVRSIKAVQHLIELEILMYHLIHSALYCAIPKTKKF